MKKISHEARQLTKEHRCFVCLDNIPEGQGVYDAGLKIYFCDKTGCRETVTNAEKDRSRSQRGRFQPRLNALEIIRFQRTTQHTVTP